LVQLGRVLLAVTGGGRGADSTAGVVDLLSWESAGGELIVNTGFHEGPGALVLGLLLDPHELGVGVAGDLGLDAVEREWGKLLDTHNCNVVSAELCSLVFNVVEDLTTAEQDFLDLVVRYGALVCIGENLHEAVALGEVIEVGVGCLQLQQLFR